MAQVADALDDEEANEPERIRDTLTIRSVQGKERPGQAFARTALRPTVQNAITARQLAHYANGDLWQDKLALDELVDALTEQVSAVNQKDLARGGAMLTAQAHTLDALYNALLRKGLRQTGLPQFEVFMKFALRAQSQCRATWEAISAIQNPPVASHVGQANIAQGPQQVNNDVNVACEGKGKAPNELLEVAKHEANKWLDRGTTSAPARGDSPVEAVGAVNRAEDRRRKSDNIA